MNNVQLELAAYYERRAPYYDAGYAKPEKEGDLKYLKGTIPKLFLDRNVLEVAAGTGYWTHLIADSAATIVATDVNPAPLALAREREYPRGNTQFCQADAYDLAAVAGTFDAAFVGFWWSHILLGDIDRFLHGLCSRLEANSFVVIVDNRDASYPSSRTDSEGNKFELRRLPDGSEYEIPKNFPSRKDLSRAIGHFGTDTTVTELEYYWMVTFTTGGRFRTGTSASGPDHV